jgi:hypothetical protein
VFLGVNWIRFLVGILIYLATYLVAIPLLGAINQADINNVRGMTSEMGVASRLFSIPLMIMEKIWKKKSKKLEKNKT